MPQLQDGLGLAVVAAEQASPAVLGGDALDEVAQVVARRSLAQQDVDPPGDAVPQLLDRAAFVVRVDQGRRIGVELEALDGGAVSVDQLSGSFRGHQFVQDAVGCRDDTGVVHELPQAEDAVVGQRLFHRRRVDDGPRMLERGGRYAGGQHVLDVQARSLGCVQHVVQPSEPADVHDLVGVRDDRGGAVRDQQAPYLLRADVGGLDVDVAVDEPRGRIQPRSVDLLVSPVAPHAGDDPPADGDVPLGDDAAVDVDHLAAPDRQVRGDAPRGRVDQPFEFRFIHDGTSRVTRPSGPG